MVQRDSRGRFIKGGNLGHPVYGGSNTRFKKGHRMMGKSIGEIMRDKPRDISGLKEYYKTHEVWNKGKKLPPLSIETRRKISNSSAKGEKSHAWRGGTTSENMKIRTSMDYKIWREAVFARDNWSCQICNQKGGKLQADHIKPFSLFPELRLAIDNGRTLCIECHKQTDTFLKNNLRREDYLVG